MYNTQDPFFVFKNGKKLQEKEEMPIFCFTVRESGPHSGPVPGDSLEELVGLLPESVLNIIAV